MTERVPGTESTDSFGKSFSEVFSPTLSLALTWLAWIGGVLTLLAWVTGNLYGDGLTRYWICWVTGYAAMKVYHAGAQAGIRWQRDKS